MLGIYQDFPCTLDWGYMVPNSRYLGLNRGWEEGLGRGPRIQGLPGPYF